MALAASVAEYWVEAPARIAVSCNASRAFPDNPVAAAAPDMAASKSIDLLMAMPRPATMASPAPPTAVPTLSYASRCFAAALSASAAARFVAASCSRAALAVSRAACFAAVDCSRAARLAAFSAAAAALSCATCWSRNARIASRAPCCATRDVSRIDRCAT
jgi:hypothetical protein